jgi:hypothetical protein
MFGSRGGGLVLHFLSAIGAWRLLFLGIFNVIMSMMDVFERGSLGPSLDIV